MIDFVSFNNILIFSEEPFLISTAIIIAGIVFRTILWFRYKPFMVESGEELIWPYVSVFMPALNEEELIESSIDSVFTSNYPQDKLEVICINDGSIDSTLFKMMKAKQKYGEKLRAIKF